MAHSPSPARPGNGRRTTARCPHAEYGTHLLYGTLSGEPAVIDSAKIRERGLQVAGCGGPGWAADIFGVDYPEFLTAAGRGDVARPAIEAVLPLADAAEAHRRLEAGRMAGRILLVP